jgi:hypothetical protein
MTGEGGVLDGDFHVAIVDRERTSVEVAIHADHSTQEITLLTEVVLSCLDDDLGLGLAASPEGQDGYSNHQNPKKSLHQNLLLSLNLLEIKSQAAYKFPREKPSRNSAIS